MSEKTTQNLSNIALFLGQALQDAADQAKEGARNEHFKELGVEWKGTKITLPDDPKKMAVRDAIKALIDLEAVEAQTYTVQEFLPGMPHDAAHAFVRVLERRYGWVNPQTKMTAFGPQPPQMVMVRTGFLPQEYVEVPIGKFKLPDISVDLETGFARNPKNKAGSFLSFYVTADVKHADRKVIMLLINETREYLKQHSIYQGKAMRLPVDRSGQVESDVAPSFIDLSKVDERGLILTKTNYDLLNHTVWTPIRKTAVARKHNIPLKRGALLYGEYGTGKTLSALVTAKIAIENGWTFIMLDDPKGLVQALEMAKLYQPAVVFAEDIDRVVVRDRNDSANDVLNTIDGAVQKNSEIITVLTTNHIEKINQGMLRPGRLDALIHVTKPDAESAIRLVRLYAGDLIDKDEPLTALGEHLSGYIPAIIAEVVNRAKLGMIFREENRIIESDLITVALLMKAHSDLLKEDKPKPSKAEAVGLALADLLGDGVSHYNGDLDDDIERINDKAGDARDYAREAAGIVGEKLPRIEKLLQGAANGSGLPTAADIKDIKATLERVATRVGVN